MINHSMLMPRDPAPEIDVTRPALPSLTPSERALIVDALEGIAKAITESAAQASIRQAPPAPETTGVLDAMPVAADFKEGDRVMWHYVCGSKEWLRGIYSAADSSNTVCRHPTDAELAEHWPDDGWIEWKGGTCPVGEMTCVQIRCRNPQLATKNTVRRADHFLWNHLGERGNGDIIAYKVLP